MSEETVKNLRAAAGLLEDCRSLQATHAKLVQMFDGTDSGDGFELIIRTFDAGCAPPIPLDLASMLGPGEDPVLAPVRRRKALLAPLVNHMAWLYGVKLRQANALMGDLMSTLPMPAPEKV